MAKIEKALARWKVVILRHAKSAWPDDVPDFERPLNKRGRRDAPAAGRWIREQVPELGLVLCSPAKRARETWELVAGQLAAEPEVRFDERLYGASVEELAEVVREVGDEVGAVLVVSHNPGVEEFAEFLGGAGEIFRTSSVEIIASDRGWRELGAGWGSSVASATPRGD